MAIDYELLFKEAQAQSDRNFKRYKRELNKAEHYKNEAERLQRELDLLSGSNPSFKRLTYIEK